ncbi:MAG: HNH endonuclease signature motif containing protein [Desulfobacteraceae bacterium]|jgi:5-methylcytosine-specific restriction endonuclease McrA
MKQTSAIPARNQKKVIQESGGICAFCGENDVATLEFHHINGRNIEHPHDTENLIYVCKNCHGKITAGTISTADVFLQKRIIKFQGNPSSKQQSCPNTVSLNNSVNNGTIANVVNFHTSKKSQPKISCPTGSIGADLNKRNYLKHIIDRYHEFAKADKGATLKYAVFYGSIKKKFGAKWDMIPTDRFSDVTDYVQKRIDATVLGKNRKSKGLKNYSFFSDYILNH